VPSRRLIHHVSSLWIQPDGGERLICDPAPPPSQGGVARNPRRRVASPNFVLVFIASPRHPAPTRPQKTLRLPGTCGPATAPRRSCAAVCAAWGATYALELAMAPPWMTRGSRTLGSVARSQLIKALEAARGNGTSMISLIMPPRDQVCAVRSSPSHPSAASCSTREAPDRTL